MQKVSRQGTAMMLASEAIILTAYPDPGTGGEPITIGGGHTAAAGGIRPRYGMKWTVAQSVRAFLEDIGRIERRVAKAITIPMKQHEFDGFASFDLNTGAISSGSVDNHWNAGRREEALRIFALYVNAGGKRMQGLANRRAKEISLIRTGKYPTSRILVKDTYKSQGRYMGIDQLILDDAPAQPLPAVQITADIPPPPSPKKPPLTLWEKIKGLFKWK